jgi:hypothetical protein
MRRGADVAKAKRHETAFKRRGVEHPHLFTSGARDEARDDPEALRVL